MSPDPSFPGFITPLGPEQWGAMGLAAAVGLVMGYLTYLAVKRFLTRLPPDEP